MQSHDRTRQNNSTSLIKYNFKIRQEHDSKTRQNHYSEELQRQDKTEALFWGITTSRQDNMITWKYRQDKTKYICTCIKIEQILNTLTIYVLKTANIHLEKGGT